MATTRPSGGTVAFLDEQDDAEYMLVGGYYISRSRLYDLDKMMKEIKEGFGLDEGDCIKWNIRDPVCRTAYEKLRCKDWPDVNNRLRRHVLSLAIKLDMRLLMSFLWKGSPSRTLEPWKDCFAYVLQRLSIVLDRKETKRTKYHNSRNQRPHSHCTNRTEHGEG